MEEAAAVAPYPKFSPIPRLFRPIIITEKLDGTNGLVEISEDGTVRAGSRNRWITPGKTTDNYGFAAWVRDNEEELRKLGVGRHYGEWWGQGIARGYGLSEKRWSLFNVSKWNQNFVTEPIDMPACVHVVPVLGYLENFSTNDVEESLRYLETWGSVAAPGFMQPEGVVVFHEKGGHLYKVTLGGDGHKGAAA